MPSAHDDQLLDAVRVRRHRLITAALYGPDRLRRHFSDGAMTMLVSAFLAAVGSAGCVGISFVQDLLSTQGRA